MSAPLYRASGEYGAFLLSAGTKGKRMSLPHSRMMIHQPLGGAQTSNGWKFRRGKSLPQAAVERVFSRTHWSTPERIARYRAGLFMSPDEAKDYGLIDQVINRHAAGSRPMATVS